MLLLAFEAGLVLLVGTFLATGDLAAPDRAAVAPILAWLIIAVVLSGERASRNPRRHVALRRMQRKLATAYAATPGTIPAGAAVRLGDPVPRYDPGRSAQEKDRSNALRP